MSKARASLIGMETSRRKTHDAEGLFARAQACQQMGLFAEAEAAYRKILRRHPNHFDTQHLLGICEFQGGNPEGAARSIKRALMIQPQSAEAHSNLSTVLRALDRFDDALACCDKAIKLKPDYIDAHYNRGNMLSSLRRFVDAIASYDAVIALDPGHISAFNNRGNALHELGRFAEAIASYDRAIALKPDHVLALNNRGCAFKDQRQLDAAIADFERALAVDPNHAGAWTNLGEALLALERLDAALLSFDRALAISPQLPEAWLGRANVLMLMRNVAEALKACETVLAFGPDSVKALTQLGQCYALQGNAESAVKCFDRALAIEPHNEAALSNKIFTLDFSGNCDFAQHQQARTAWWREIGSRIFTRHALPHDNDRDPKRRLVVGYVSSDFRRRSPAVSFRPVLANHEKETFQVICYSGSPKEDEVTESFRHIADRWRDITQWSDDQLADCIRADKVDILVDLSGHTGGNRLRVFARKPAPIQVTAWGFGTGTGMPSIDYLFSDPVSLPVTARHLFAEQIHDLPCVLIIEPPDVGLRCSEPPSLANGYTTYGAFNRVSKFSDAAIAVWARILRSDGRARLLIKDQLIDDPSIQSMLREKFASHGIASDRIDMLGSTPREEHLAAYAQVDICLDPFPQNGGVSTWEALYMGVPVVTKLGDSVSSRAAGGIVSAVGLGEWVASSDDEYVEIALRSAPERLRTIRHDLPDLIAARCSPAAYTKAVEEAYRTMWKKYCSSSRS